MPFDQRTPLPARFTRIAWSSVLTQFAEQIALVAAPLAAVLILGAGATETALLQVAQTLPFLLLAIPFGLIVDRSSPKRVLVASETLRGLTLTGTVALILMDSLTFEALLILGFVGAIGTLGASVAIPSTVPQLVPRGRLMDANQWLELGRSIAFISGPVIAGAIVSLAGAEAAFVVAAIACSAAVALLARIDIARTPPSPSRRIIGEIADALRFVISHNLLRPMVVTSMVFNVGWFLIQSVFVVYALRSLGMTPATVGTAMGVFGVGMVSGALAARPLSKRISLGRMSVIGPVCGFVGAVLLVATLWLPSPVIALGVVLPFRVRPRALVDLHHLAAAVRHAVPDDRSGFIPVGRLHLRCPSDRRRTGGADRCRVGNGVVHRRGRCGLRRATGGGARVATSRGARTPCLRRRARHRATVLTVQTCQFSRSKGGSVVASRRT
ncbi:MAG: transporter [Microbacterium sp.]|nr:transporter [Microbacterium sp.]